MWRSPDSTQPYAAPESCRARFSDGLLVCRFRPVLTAEGLSVQEAPQRLTRVVLGLSGHAGIRRTIKPVKRSRVQVKFDRHAGPTQSSRIGHVFFEEEIKTAD